MVVLEPLASHHQQSFDPARIERPLRLAAESREPAAGADDFVDARLAEQIAVQCKRQLREELPLLHYPFWRLDCLPRVLGKRQLDESRKQHVQALAFEKVRSGNQPVRVTVTLALDRKSTRLN